MPANNSLPPAGNNSLPPAGNNSLPPAGNNSLPPAENATGNPQSADSLPENWGKLNTLIYTSV